MTGCTISVAWFVITMNLRMKTGRMQCKGPKAVMVQNILSVNGCCDCDDSINQRNSMDRERTKKDENIVKVTVLTNLGAFTS